MLAAAHKVGVLALLAGLSLASFTAMAAGMNEPAQQRQGEILKSKNMPDGMLRNACTTAMQAEDMARVRARLAEQVGFAIDEQVGYVEAEVTNFKLSSNADAHVCTGMVSITDMPLSIAATAVRAAWAQYPELTPEQLKQLLQVALSHGATAADGAALIAKLAPAQQGLAYAKANVDLAALQLDDARLAVAELMLQGGEIATAMMLANSCGSVACRKLLPQIKQELRAYEAKQAMDLNSYFGN